MGMTTDAYWYEEDDWGLTSFDLPKVLALRDAYVEGRFESAFTIRHLFRYARRALRRSPPYCHERLEAPLGNSEQDSHQQPVREEKRCDERSLTGSFRVATAASSGVDGRVNPQHLFDDGTALALLSVVTKDPRYVEHAGRCLRSCFLEPDSRTDKLHSAKIVSRSTGNEGLGRRGMQWAGLHYYVDAVRIMERLGVLTAEETESFREWLRAHLKWLEAIAQSKVLGRSPGYYGVYYDLQLAAIWSFLGDAAAVQRVICRAREELPLAFSPRGVPYEAMRSTRSAHYACLILQGWLHLAALSRRCGDELAQYHAPNGASLRVAVDWLSCHFGFPWPYEQKGDFDGDRFVPIVQLARDVGLPVDVSAGYETTIAAVVQEKPVFGPYDGIRPFWNI